MKELKLVLILLFLTISLYGQQYKLDTIFMSGAIENRINYVVLGDGYLQSQLSDFNKDAVRIVEDLFTTSPYANYKQYFNVFSVGVASNAEGAAVTPESPIDNFYGSTFNYAGIERLLVPQRTNKVAEVLAATLPSYDQVIMIVNSTTYGGSGGWIATSSVNGAASEIMIHELGHSFANLTDEYWAGDQYAREGHNMTQEKAAAKVIWRNWLGEQGIGIIAHKESPTWHKPHDRCKMQFLGDPFCAVCKEAFINKIHNLVTPIDAFSPTSSTIEKDKPVAFDLSLISPAPNTLAVKWLLNGKMIDEKKASITLQSADIAAGQHELEAKVIDATTDNRKDKIYVNRVNWKISSSAQGVSTKSIEDRNEVVTSIPISRLESTSRVYPVPANDRLNVAYFVRYNAQVRISLIDNDGKLLAEWLNEYQPAGEYKLERDLSRLSRGFYLIKVQIGDTEQVHKVIK